MGIGPSTEPTSSHTINEYQHSLIPNSSLASSSSGSGGGSQAPVPSVLECWLAWFYASLVQAITAAVSSFMQRSCSPWPLALTVFLDPPTYSPRAFWVGQDDKDVCGRALQRHAVCALMSVVSVLAVIHYIKKFLRWDLRVALIYGYSDTDLEGNFILCLLSRIIGVGSPQRTMNSLAMSSWPDLQ